jgi:predicted nucleotidyltransferase
VTLPIGKRNPTRRVSPHWKKFDANTTSGGTVLNQDFKEFVQSLNENKVRYLVIGGYAVAFHGHPRYTKDLDVWVESSPENAASVVKALEQFGFASLGLKAEDFLTADQIIQMGLPPSRIDILTSVEGIEFESCYASRVPAVIDGIRVNFIDLENLKKNKRAAGRAQDLADLEKLE